MLLLIGIINILAIAAALFFVHVGDTSMATVLPIWAIMVNTFIIAVNSEREAN